MHDPGGLHHRPENSSASFTRRATFPPGRAGKSEIPDQANEASRRLIVEWTARP